MAPGSAIEYKYVVVRGDGVVKRWEPFQGNRMLVAVGSVITQRDLFGCITQPSITPRQPQILELQRMSGRSAQLCEIALQWHGPNLNTAGTWLVDLPDDADSMLVGSDMATISPQRKALVVGIGAYHHCVQLSRPANDATDVQAALQRMGFITTLVLDCGMSAFTDAVRGFLSSICERETALFYFAGHGVEAVVRQGTILESSNWLVSTEMPCTTTADLPRFAIDAAAMLADMQAQRARFNVVILDCCRDNPLPAEARGTLTGLRAMLAPEGSIIAYACAPNQSAAETHGERNGLYTKHLLRHIETPGLRIEDFFILVGNGVRHESHERRLPRGQQDPYTNSALRVIGASLSSDGECVLARLQQAEIELAKWRRLQPRR